MPMSHAPSREITKLLLAWGGGEDAALKQLVPRVYRELRRLAQWHMRGERAGHTLQTTALINEAYLRLVGCRQIQWQDRIHFFSVSSKLMRRILVDFARSRRYQKRGGGAEKVTLDEGLIMPSRPGRTLIALDDALNALAVTDARKASVVELRFFGGLSVDETAEALKISADTVLRDWTLAKAWLTREMSGNGLYGT